MADEGSVCFYKHKKEDESLKCVVRYLGNGSSKNFQFHRINSKIFKSTIQQRFTKAKVL